MPMFASLAGNWSSQKKLFTYKYWMASGSFGGFLSSSIVDTSGNIYLRNGAVVTKISSLGAVLWSYTYLSMSGSTSQPSMVLDPNQDIIIAHAANASPNAGGITKISKTDGAVLWTRTTSSAVGTGWYNTNAVTVDPSGNIYFICDDGIATGTFPDKSYMIVKFNNSGTWQWQRKINIGTVVSATALTDLPSVIIANNSYVYFGGMVANTSAAFYGALTSAGAFSWSKTHTPANKITGVALDSSGNVYFGDGNNNTNGIMKFNATGTILWQKTIKTAANGSIVGPAYINIDAGDNIYYMPDSKPLIIKYNTSGTVVWQRLLTSTTKTFSQVTNVAPFPTASSSIFVGALSSGGVTSYGVLPSDGTAYTAGEWAITTPANLNVDYARTTTTRTPTVTTITPVIVTTAMSKTLFTPSSITLTPLDSQ